MKCYYCDENADDEPEHVPPELLFPPDKLWPDGSVSSNGQPLEYDERGRHYKKASPEDLKTVPDYKKVFCYSSNSSQLCKLNVDRHRLIV